MYSDEYFNGTEKNPWDQVFMRSDNDGPKNEDYKISSSLKTIWSDASDSKTNSFCNIVDRHSDAQGCSTQTQLATEYVQFGNNVIAIECDFQSKPQKPIDTESYYNTANNNVNPNLLKGRPITSRNGGYVTHFGTENQLQYSSQLSDLLPHQKSQTLEAFLQKVQVIVKNGFLDPKILHEPISPETFDLIQMLIFYVMEYSRAKDHSSKDEINSYFYKINLIQNEIAKCQLNYIQHSRVQQQILQSFSPCEAKQQNFTAHPLSNQYGRTNVKSQWRNAPKTDMPNQRYGQRQFDQLVAQPPIASSSGTFTFLPKAKNIDKCSQYYDPSRYYLQRDGNHPTN